MAKFQAVFTILLIIGQTVAVSAYLAETVNFVKETASDYAGTVGFVAGAAAVGVLGPFALAGMGFTAAGITAGSIGATLMSYGAPVAVLQSAGAAGISYTSILAGGALGAASAQGAKHILKEDEPEKSEKSWGFSSWFGY